MLLHVVRGESHLVVESGRAMPLDLATSLSALIESRTARVGICGLGYVGLPLATATARAGFHTTGFDIDTGKVMALKAGHSYIPAVTTAELSELVQAGTFSATG